MCPNVTFNPVPRSISMKKFLALALAAGVCAPFVLSAQDKKPQDPEAAFKRMDKNSDNKLSLEEYMGNTQEADKKTKKENRFKALDTNKDNSLDLAEFKAGAKKKK
jgi:Ca2+-binding EF-hand superfamily protein